MKNIPYPQAGCVCETCRLMNASFKLANGELFIEPWKGHGNPRITQHGACHYVWIKGRSRWEVMDNTRLDEALEEIRAEIPQ